jgi:hypothetical protein
MIRLLIIILIAGFHLQCFRGVIIYEFSYYPQHYWKSLKESIVAYDGDINGYIEPRKKRYFFVYPNQFRDIDMGISEKELKLFLNTESIDYKFTYCEPYPYLLTKDKYIPVDKKINIFSSIGTYSEGKITEKTSYRSITNRERAYANFFFYKDRLIYKSYYHTRIDENRDWHDQPDTTEDVLYRNSTTDGVISDSHQKFYIIVKGLVDKKYFRYPCTFKEDLSGLEVDRGSVEKFYKTTAYWEAPDFEEKLRKSGYYDYKAKLDKDFEEKKGYWNPKK